MSASPKPRLEWLDDDTALVLIDHHGHAPPHHIADLFWNGMEWFFIPYGYEPHSQWTVDYWSYIRVDTERWVQLRDKTNTLAEVQHTKAEAERAALGKELELERKEFRDDTKEFAELAAIGKARVWWRTAYSLWVEGCTGGPQKFGGEILHDAGTCPVHES